MSPRSFVWISLGMSLVPIGGLMAVTLTTGCMKVSSSYKAELDAANMFNTKCAACHGLEGNGKGPASDKCNPKPRDYTDKAWQATVTDESIEKTIVYGGAAVGKSAVMPSSPELAEKPEVVKALRKRIRGFAGL